MLSLVHTEHRDQLLTDRQRESLTVAHEHGCFDVPRGATPAQGADALTGVFDALGADPSSASETIRRATNRVIEEFILSRNQ